jgi:hypothetical protein
VTDDDFGPPSPTQLSLSTGTAAGLAGLLIGCSLLISACALMMFNVVLFSIGMRGIPVGLAQLGGIIGAGGVAILGAFGVASGLRGWSAANRDGESNALGIAGTAAGIVGLIAWIIAGIDLIFILFR